MIHDIKPFHAYKDSGVPWLGEVPEHWEVRRLKFLLREVDSRSISGKEQLLRVSQYTGVTQRIADNVSGEPDTRAASLINYKRVAVNDLVINIMLAWNGSMGVSRYDGIVSPAYCIYRFESGALPWYYHELLRLPVYKGRIKTASTGIVESRLRLYSDDLGRIEAIFPPFHEQAVIVRFLDHAGRRIRRYIRAKQKLIKLLEEQKQAIIHRAVTRGLDPSAPLKPAGIDWLGNIPKHWEVKRLKFVSKMKSGEGITGLQINSNGGYPVYGGNGLRGYTSSFTHDGKFVLIGRQGALCGNIHHVSGKFWASEHAVVVTPVAGINASWLGALLRVINLNQYSIAAAQPGLAVERVLNLSVPVPSANEQERIAAYIESETKELGAGTLNAQREISLLREYRTRLFADVVTGKLDVRAASALMPDETEEVEPLDEADALAEGEDEAMPEEVTDAYEA